MENFLASFGGLALGFLGAGLAVGFWFLGILGLKAFGTGHESAYYTFKNGASDTDTTANSLGTMTTCRIGSLLSWNRFFFRKYRNGYGFLKRSCTYTG